MAAVKGRIAVAGFALGVATTVAILATFATIQAAGVGGETRVAGPRTLDRPAFEQAVHAVFDRYFEPVDEAAILSAGLRAMLAQLDPHSHFLSAADRKALRQRKSGGVTGLAVALRGDEGRRHLEVLAVAPDSPAHRKGVRPGDHVVKIGDRECERLESQVHAELLLGGVVGDEVALVVQSKDEPDARALVLALDTTTPVAGEVDAGLASALDTFSLAR